ncbi:MAG: histidine phosphatase family protein [Actinomycetota bacterium]|nr:histidine phosphatase family protein [Actinomycetota bacterium]
MLLLRHASAGEPMPPPWFDRERALDRIGRFQARHLRLALAGFAIERIVTSPHTRCVETVRPLAVALGLELERRDALAPDSSQESALALLEELPAESLLCTHREVVERLFDGDVQCEKGGAWVFERTAGRWHPTGYRAAPAVERLRGRAALV